MEPTTIHYDITEDDVVEFNIQHARSRWQRHSLGYHITLVVIAILILEVMVFPLTSQFRFDDDLDLRWLLYVAPIIYLGCYFLLLHWRARIIGAIARRAYRRGRNVALYGKKTITFTREGLRVVEEFGESLMRWKGVEKVTYNNSAIYIYSSALTAVIIPRRAFASDFEFGECLAYAQNSRELLDGIVPSTESKANADRDPIQE